MKIFNDDDGSDSGDKDGDHYDDGNVMMKRIGATYIGECTTTSSANKTSPSKLHMSYLSMQHVNRGVTIFAFLVYMLLPFFLCSTRKTSA